MVDDIQFLADRPGVDENEPGQKDCPDLKHKLGGNGVSEQRSSLAIFVRLVESELRNASAIAIDIAERDLSTAWPIQMVSLSRRRPLRY